MNFEEWLRANDVIKHINIPNITYDNIENVIGKQYWICDYRLNENKDSKPIRNIIPKLVQVFSNDDLPNNKNVHYSPIHFREVKNGKIQSTVIAPYDNTGYRFYQGVSVNIFTTERECRDCFKDQCVKAIHEYNDKLEELTKEIRNRMDEIHELRIKHGNF